MAKGYLFDLDGTIYKGTTLCEGAAKGIEFLEEHKIPYMFVTNNSTKTPIEFSQFLASLGLQVHADRILTSAVGMGYYMKDKGYTRAYVIGESGLHRSLRDLDIHICNTDCTVSTIETCSVDVVVVGLQRNVTYEELQIAALLVQKGAKLLGTNSDKRYPTEIGTIPGAGTLLNVVADASGVKPIVIGKPEHHLISIAEHIMSIGASELCMIGDNYDTDIMFGMNHGLSTYMVLGGVSTFEDVKEHYVPNRIFNTLTDIFNYIEEQHRK